MDEKLHSELIELTDKLRSLLSECSIYSISYVCAHKFSTIPVETHNLYSPFKQIVYLLGHAIALSEPDNPKVFDEDEWSKCVKVLNEIFSLYGKMYFNTSEPDRIIKDSSQKGGIVEVSMSSFLHYFNSGLLADTNQIKDRIKRYLFPFNNEIKELLHLSFSEIYEIIEWISDKIQENIDNLIASKKDYEKAHKDFFDKAEKEKWDINNVGDLKEKAKNTEFEEMEIKCVEKTVNLFSITRNEVEKQFGKVKADKFWELFVSSRVENEEFIYLTDHNTINYKPLIQIDDNNAICLSVHCLYLATMSIGEKTLLESEKSEAFLKKRDKVLEEETYERFKELFGDEATLLKSVYETETLQNEHDLVIIWKKQLFIIESKASPPVEPFRDPKKAYVRIKRHFNSDRGIQKGYEQADRLRKILQNDKIINLYDEKRNCILTVNNTEIEKVYCICVTRDNYGQIAVDLALLLEKENKYDPYPWSINILDLDNIVKAWKYFSLGINELCEYLNKREKLHGKIRTDDELNIVGYFLEKKEIDSLVNKKGMVILLPDNSEIFDEIFYGAKFKKEKSQEKPLAEMNSANEISKTVPYRRTHPKVGRNDPCPCGSGKKYKKCHGTI